MLLHASSVAINNQAVLLMGASGIGKSDLALRLMDGGATLIADDQTVLTKKDAKVIASAPDLLRGLIEVRHVGLLQVAKLTSAAVALAIDLVPTDAAIERLPEKNFITLLDVPIRHLILPAFASSTPAKIRAALMWREEGEDGGGASDKNIFPRP